MGLFDKFKNAADVTNPFKVAASAADKAGIPGAGAVASAADFTSPLSVASRVGTEAGLGKPSTEGFSPEQQAFINFGNRAIGDQRNSPEFQAYQKFLNDQASQTNAALPGVQQFIQKESAQAQAQRAAQQAQNQQTQGSVNDALARLMGLSSGQNAQNVNNLLSTSGTALTPELQALVDQERNLAIQRANIGVDQNVNDRASQLTAQLAARGLSASSVASRGLSDLQADALNQQENARIAAEQQGLERELQLRNLGLQSRGQDLSSNLGLLSQLSTNNTYGASLANQNLGLGQDRVAQLDQLTQQFGAPNELATLLQLGQAGNTPLQTQSQQNLENELNVLRTAQGVQGSQGPGLGAQLGTLAAAAAPALITAFSDKNLKEDIRDGSDDVQEFLDSAKPYTYKYKGGKKDFHGIMAQDLEDTALGKKHIQDTPLGKLVNFENMTTIVAGLGHLNNKVKQLESNKKGKK